MQIEQVFTRESVTTAKGHMARTAERLLATYPGATEVVIVRRGGRGRCPEPKPSQIVYVASTGGKWGKSRKIRHGRAVGPSRVEIELLNAARCAPIRNIGQAFVYVAIAKVLAASSDIVNIARDAVSGHALSTPVREAEAVAIDIVCERLECQPAVVASYFWHARGLRRDAALGIKRASS